MIVTIPPTPAKLKFPDRNALLNYALSGMSQSELAEKKKYNRKIFYAYIDEVFPEYTLISRAARQIRKTESSVSKALAYLEQNKWNEIDTRYKARIVEGLPSHVWRGAAPRVLKYTQPMLWREQNAIRIYLERDKIREVKALEDLCYEVVGSSDQEVLGLVLDFPLYNIQEASGREKIAALKFKTERRDINSARSVRGKVWDRRVLQVEQRDSILRKREEP